MSTHAYFLNGEHYPNGHHLFQDDRGNTSSFVFGNCFQSNPPSNSIDRKSSGQRSWNEPFAPNSHHLLSPPIGNNSPWGIAHFSENSYNVQNTHISNVGNLHGNLVMRPKGSRSPGTKAKERTVAHKVQNVDEDSEEASTTSDFDEAFPISNRGRRSTRRGKPHTPFRSIPPPDPQPTRYLSVPPVTYSAPMTSYDPFSSFGSMFNASMQAALYGMNQAIQQNILAQEASARSFEVPHIEATRTARLATYENRRSNVPSRAATPGREDVSANTRRPSSCPGFSEYKSRDDAGNTTTIAKNCSHVDCAFLSRDFFPTSSGISRSSKSWRTLDCGPGCPGSIRRQETDNLGNVKVVTRLCSHESDSTGITDSGSNTDVESPYHYDSDDFDYERAKRASMQPSVQDVSDVEE